MKLIVEGKQQANISPEGLEWFYNSVKNGKSGPFVCRTINGEKCAVLSVKLTEQIGLFE